LTEPQTKVSLKAAIEGRGSKRFRHINRSLSARARARPNRRRRLLGAADVNGPRFRTIALVSKDTFQHPSAGTSLMVNIILPSLHSSWFNVQRSTLVQLIARSAPSHGLFRMGFTAAASRTRVDPPVIVEFVDTKSLAEGRVTTFVSSGHLSDVVHSVNVLIKAQSSHFHSNSGKRHRRRRQRPHLTLIGNVPLLSPRCDCCS